ncbi:hypothetical protein HK097_000049, partial [Rhizophlyctis rosea]
MAKYGTKKTQTPQAPQLHSTRSFDFISVPTDSSFRRKAKFRLPDVQALYTTCLQRIADLDDKNWFSTAKLALLEQ